MTWRPTPTSAAFGRVWSGGTSTTRSSVACARQARRHPARSSSGENARGSTEPTGTSPSTIRTLHFLHVPWPPHVESIAIPFQLAASKIGVPLGTRTSAPSGRKRRRTRAGPRAGARRPPRPAADADARSRGRGHLGLPRAVGGDPAPAPRVVAEQQVGGA